MEAYQMDLFGTSLPEYRIKNKIRLIECFGGIGAQARAMEVLQDEGLISFEHHRLVEWAAPSIIAYNAIHMHDWKDYSEGKSVEELVRLTNGISVNYNEPMTDTQRLKKGEKWLRRVYSSMVATHDLCPDISKVHWNDLGITERDKYTYVLSYSFPCQDLSNAGLLKGMRKGSGTRSGLLWEVERILLECKEHDCLPQVLLMENVRGVLSDKESFGSWDGALHKMGYTSYVKILNSKDFGIPQNRERVFMMSILGDYAYNFPTPFKRKYSLKDFLDSNVDKKYYLSEEHLKSIANWKAQQKPIENMEKRKDLSPTLTARGAGEEHSGMVLIKDKPPESEEEMLDAIHTVGNYGNGHHAKDISATDGVMPTITTGNHGLGQAIAEKEVSNSIKVGGRGSLDKHEWDIVAEQNSDIKVMGQLVNKYGKTHPSELIYRADGIAPTMLARDYKEPKMVAEKIEPTLPIKEATIKGYKEAKEGDGVDIGSRMESHRGTVQDGIAQTIKCSIEVGVVVDGKSD